MSFIGIRVGAIKELKIKHLKKLQENTNNIGILVYILSLKIIDTSLY